MEARSEARYGAGVSISASIGYDDAEPLRQSVNLGVERVHLVAPATVQKDDRGSRSIGAIGDGDWSVGQLRPVETDEIGQRWSVLGPASAYERSVAVEDGLDTTEQNEQNGKGKEEHGEPHRQFPSGWLPGWSGWFLGSSYEPDACRDHERSQREDELKLQFPRGHVSIDHPGIWVRAHQERGYDAAGSS
jgi:hypothetical protein